MFGHIAGQPLECFVNQVLLQKTSVLNDRGEQVLDETGKPLYKCGFRIAGGIDQDNAKSPQGYPDKGIYVTFIQEGGPADLAGLLMHDKILQVNGHDMTMVTHKKAVDYISRKPVLEMFVYRPSIGNKKTDSPGLNSFQENPPSSKKSNNLENEMNKLNFQQKREQQFQGFENVSNFNRERQQHNFNQAGGVRYTPNDDSLQKDWQQHQLDNYNIYNKERSYGEKNFQNDLKNEPVARSNMDRDYQANHQQHLLSAPIKPQRMLPSSPQRQNFSENMPEITRYPTNSPSQYGHNYQDRSNYQSSPMNNQLSHQKPSNLIQHEYQQNINKPYYQQHLDSQKLASRIQNQMPSGYYDSNKQVPNFIVDQRPVESRNPVTGDQYRRN